MTVRDDLHSWLSTLPVWQQDLARRLAEVPYLDGDDYAQALAVVLAAHGALPDGETAPEAQAIVLDDLPGADDGGGTVRLLQVRHLRGVGLVADDQEIRFAEQGLTIVYGPNAAGKSTYVGALKRVCRTVDYDTGVRGNVYARDHDRPTATVEYERTGVRRAQQIDLESPQETGLESISVFDSRCAELYLNARNDVAYVPSSLFLLARLAGAQDQMRGDIDGRVRSFERTQPAFPELDGPSEAQRRVEALRADTDVDELRAFCELNEAERTRLSELRAALAMAAGNTARADADAALLDAREARELLEALRAAAERAGPDSCEELRRVAAAAKSARDAVEGAAREFEGLERPGVGAEPWQRMWQAARDFVEAGDRRFPPTSGESCPLCLQMLDNDTASRFEHFEAHVRSSLQEQARATEAQLSARLGDTDPSHVEALRTTFVERLAEREATLFQAVDGALAALTTWMASARANPTTVEPVAIELPADALEEWAAAREQHAEILRAALDPEGERVMREELREFEARERLAGRMTEIANWIATLGRVRALQRAHSALATNRITIKQRELSQQTVTGALATALGTELTRLKCNHLPVDVEPYASHGTTQVALRLAGAHGVPRVSEILSEGEQRAVSLAFFLAESATADGSAGLIVDDPVSSLDDERRSYIAKRLVREARTRQVIVFTHDLPFMLDLVEQAEQTDLESLVHGIWRYGDSVGRVDENPPFSAMKFRQRVGLLTERAEQWDAQPEPRNADEAWHRVCDFYADMRATWERGIEERLFRGVVQRFQREVKTLKLPAVEVTPELVAMIEEGMTRCSQFVHDAAPGTMTAIPSRAELAGDIEKLRAFQAATRGS